MAALLESNKTKIAKRVIEVFEFFDANCQRATVMDIVRRYGRPQSSTSELLASLVDLGLLYKDSRSRSYFPTPRLATLGTSAQPKFVRDGRLFSFMDGLAESTGHCVAMFGVVGTNVQIFRSAAGARPLNFNLDCGASEPLCASTAGLLLLSTMGTEQVTRMLWRLNAEAAPGFKFNPNELGERVAELRRQGGGTGPCGFVPDMRVTAQLLPRDGEERPLCLGVIYPASASGIEPDALTAQLKEGVRQFEPWAMAADAPMAMSA